jgi:hypothetical protein
MPLKNGAVKTPARPSWEQVVDPCPFFDNYSKYFAGEATVDQFARPTVESEAKVEKPAKKKKVKVSNDTWVAR